MFPVEAFERTIGKFVAIAEAIGLPFHLTGGSISSAYGEPRLTQDIDIVVSPEVAKHRIDNLVKRLACVGFTHILLRSPANRLLPFALNLLPGAFLA